MNDIIKIDTILSTIVDKTYTTFQEDITTIKDVTTKAFLISGKILQNIQDGKKYKEAGYKTFAEAVKVELGLDKPQAYRLIAAAEAYENLVPIGTNLPTSESQLRPIIKLLPDQQKEVWLEAAKDKVPTAKEVQLIATSKFGNNKGAVVTTPPKPSSVSIEEYEKVVQSNNEYLEMINQQALVEASLIAKISELEKKLQQYEPVVEDNDDSNILLPRTTVFEFVSKHCNKDLYRYITEDNPSDERLFNMFISLRSTYIEKNSPFSLPKDILNATGIIPRE